LPTAFAWGLCLGDGAAPPPALPQRSASWLASAGVVWILYQREFHSEALRLMMRR